jgi:hypothetical protein
MAQKNKALIVLGSLVVIGSVGYYLFSKSKKGSMGEGSLEPTPNDSPSPTPTPTPKITPKPIVGKTYKVKDYLNTSKAIMDFQDWMDKNHPNWVNGKNLNKGSGYGTHIGKNTQKAWDNHSAEYVALLSQKKQKADERGTLNSIKRAFPIGKSVIATITFRAFANRFRNGQWFSTDTDGNTLPSKEFKATSVVGKVVTVTDDGFVILQVSPPLKSATSGNEFNQIKVKSNWIR